jgi:O-methyltransferase
MDRGFRPIFEACAPFSMTSLERMYALYKAVLYVIQAKIPGDFVECGVWKGGSAMIIAETLKALGVTDRNIYLYDTFEGMPEPDERDIKIRTGATGKSMWLGNQSSGGWCNISIEEVTENVLKTGYPKERFVFVKGKVEDTIPKTIPNAIAILRLDTDWYASTIHEFEHLYPLLSEGGVLMIDDYGSWSGSRDATNKYFKEHTISMYLHRVDMARVGIKSNA